MNCNIELGEKFARQFNKKYGVITYSGTLAVEVALLNTGLKKNSKILVSSEVCYSIINTILKLNFSPVIITPENGFSFTDADIEKVLEKQHIDCIMLVHQYGLLNNINLKKYQKKGIKIIEDVAQIWKIENNEYKIGKNSDIVVTSFGSTKPLSYGIGGGLFFDEKIIFNSIDYCDNISREKQSLLLSYTYPLCEQIDFDKLVTTADSIIKEQKNNAKEYYELLKNNSFIKCFEWNDKNVWHRFPIWIDDDNIYNEVIKGIAKTNLEYQLPHEIKLEELDRNKSCIKYIKKRKNIILLRTRNVNMDNQIKILRKVIRIVDKI